MQYPHFIGGSHTVQSPIADGQRTVNWYVERQQLPGGKSQMALYPTPGVETLATATTASGRGHFYQDGREFAVIGTTFYEIGSTGTLTSRGTVAIDDNPATISSNGDGGGEVFITSGNNGYVFTLATNLLTQVRTGATTIGGQIDGYFVVLDAATSTLFISDLLDGTTWDPTQFAQRSSQSDPWVSMAVLPPYIWLLGEQTSDVWYNAGTFPFPFAPHPSGRIDYGCAAAFSPEIVAGSVIWLAQTADGMGQVVRAGGFTPQVISTYAVQVALDSFSTLSDAIGDTYQDLGHSFYLLYFPTASATWVFDATESLWHERGTWISEDAIYEAWRPLYHAFAFGEHRMLDRASGKVFRMASDLGFDADARPLRRLRRPPSLWADNERLFVSLFAIDLEPGLGLATGQGSDPQMMLRISRDGGKTWGSERWRSAGAIGKYETRTQWVRCGSARHWVPEVVVSDPIPWRLTGARVEVKGAVRREAA
jgi:hypothetical protein